MYSKDVVFINIVFRKKIIILILIILPTLLLGVFLANITGIFAIENDLAPADSLGGDKNIFISYLGARNIDGKLQYVGLTSKEEYKRLFSYYKVDGTTNYETFMDSVIVMPANSYCSRNSIIDLYQGHDYIHNNLNRSFKDSTNDGMDLFDRTVLVDEMKELENMEQAITELNNSCIADDGTNCNRKIDIYLGVYEPKINDINTLIKHFVDEQITEFNKKNFQNLNLAGFYYVTEQIHYAPYPKWGDDENVARYFNSYVHSIKDDNNKSIYKTIWCPYYGAPGGHHSDSNYVYSESPRVAENEKFDFTSAQTNYYFKSDSSNNYKTDFLTDSGYAASTYGYGLEVELDANVIHNENLHFYKYINWLKYAVENGWNNSINLYYAPTTLVDVSKSQIPQERNIYDFTYKYAKETLTLSELDVTYSDTTVSSNDYFDKDSFKNLMQELSPDISMSGAFTRQTSSSCTSYDYCSATEETLRDGVFGRKNYGSSWVVFHENMKSPYEIVVDLKTNQTSLTNFGIEYANIPKDDIKVPAEISISVSDDNITYKACDISNISEKQRAYASYFNYDAETSCSGRYIKFEFTSQSHALLISEIVIGQTDIILDKLSTEIIKDLSEDIVVSVDKNGGSLSATSSDSSIAQCNIVEDDFEKKLHIIGNNSGMATCIITEDKYNSSVGVNVIIKQNDEEIYVYLDNSLSLDNSFDDGSIIYNLKSKNSISNILNKIYTNGVIKIFNDTNEVTDENEIIKTGCQVKVTLTDRIKNYILSVKGDISGDGISDITDLVQTAKYVMNKNNQEFNAFEKAKRKAVDMNDNDILDITDIVQLAKSIR